MDWNEAVRKLYICLNLKRRAVGIKFCRSRDDFEKAPGICPLRPMNYCQAVAAASYGNGIRLKRESFKCSGGLRALGICRDDPRNLHGENWARLGMYEAGVCRTVREKMDFLEDEAFGVAAAPAESFDRTPDVVIVIGTPYVMMRISQAYAYHYGMPENLRFAGNQAFCAECTSRPYKTGDLNFSMLCIGTRHQAGWDDTEAAAGISGRIAENVADGLWKTVNIMESDVNKARIEAAARAQGFDIRIRYHYNYYMDC